MVILLPLAGVIQAPSPEKILPVAPRLSATGSGHQAEPTGELPGDLPGKLPSKIEDVPLASPPIKLPSVADRDFSLKSGINFAGQATNQEVIDYLTEVGFGAEYGSSSTVLHKWTRDVNLRVYGSPTAADIATLSQVVGELNDLISGIELTLNNGPADLEVHFAPESQFHSIEPHYMPVNYGFFRVRWDHEGAIYEGRILVASQGITQQERSHLIREEITQSLGLF